MDSLKNKQNTNITPEKLLDFVKQKENLKIGSGLLVGEIKPEEIQSTVEKTKIESEKLEAVREKILGQMGEMKEESKIETKEKNIESIEVKKLAQEKLVVIKEIRDINAKVEELEKNTVEPVIQKKEEKPEETETVKIDEEKVEEDARSKSLRILDEHKKEINDFVNKIKTGGGLKSPWDLQYYENNKEEIEEELKNISSAEEKIEKVNIFLEEEYAFSDEELEKLTTDNHRILKKNSKLFKNYPTFKKILLAGAILIGGALIHSKKDKTGNPTYQNIKDTTSEKTVSARQKNAENFTINKKHKKQTVTNTEENHNTNQIESEKPIELNVNQGESGSTNTIESEKPTELNTPSYGYDISGQREVTNKTQIIESEKPVELKRQKQNKTPEATQTTTKETKEEPKKEVEEEKVEKEDLSKKFYYNIQQRTLDKVNEIYESNLVSLFPDNKKTFAWDNIKDSKELTAEFMMDKKEGSSNGIYNPYISYLHKLHFKTGLNPKTGETNEEYVRRAIQKLAKMEKLNDAKL